MKNRHIHFIAAGIETTVFFWIGILLIGIVTRNITRFFVVHRLKPFIFGSGIVFLLWGIQRLRQFSSSDRQKQAMIHHDRAYFFHLGVFLVLTVFVSIPIFRYLKTGTKAANTLSLTGPEGPISHDQLDSQVRRYSDSQFNAVESAQNSSQSAASYQNAVQHSFTTTSDDLLHGYYPEEKKILISDTEGAGWIKEIENHTSSYIGWSVTVKGCVVSDPSIFSRGMFCPSRELMTCCVADLSLIGFTCLYDPDGPFSGLIRDGTWVSVTGTVKQGEYQGQPEPQLVCTSVIKADPPADPYLYP
ncbi:MAG: TIGR03943 family protein [Treponema sp.]|nr:TIGR03943 family protein [Treponema sp.]